MIARCPRCGKPLQAHVGAAQDAPWLCAPCHRGYWTAELESGSYRRLQDDFGRPAPDVASERKAAFERGHSVSDEVAKVPGVAEELRRSPWARM